MTNTENNTVSQIHVDNKSFVDQINKLYTYFNECSKKFIEEPNCFDNLMKKIAEYSEQNKSHLDLAKDIGFPEPLVAHLVNILLFDMKSKKIYSEEFLNTVENFVVKAENTSENVVNIGLEDVGDFTWADDMWVYNVPCDFDFPEGFNLNSDFSVSSNDEWSIYLRLEDNYCRKNYIEASSEEEKLEIVEMLSLMKKYLAYN